VVWDWALEQFVDGRHEKALAETRRLFADTLFPPAGLTALPWFNVPNPLRPDTVGGGTFYGLQSTTTARDLVRAVACALVFEMRRVAGEAVDRGWVDAVVLGGGASKGSFFRTLFAAAFASTPVSFFVHEARCGTRGAVYAFSARAAAATARRAPKPPAGVCDELARRYDYYLAVFERVYGGGYRLEFETKPTAGG
jgi:sugar (pentulose or hexulose) kinase